MEPLTCFQQDFAPDTLDRSASLFHHRLMGDPALSLQNLARVIPRLPADQVFHSHGQLDLRDDLDRAHLDHRPAQRLAAALEQLRESNAYIMVREPEHHPSFMPLLRQLTDDVARMARAADVPGRLGDIKLYLFIASPNSVTPFHIDRYSTFLLQFRGSKQVCVFPPWDERVVDDEDAEHFFARTGRRPVWRAQAEALGTSFQFAPGQALHIPFAAGHHVRNGSEDVSISLSIIFNTAPTRRLMRALAFNHHARPWLRSLGITPRRVAPDAPGVERKAALWRMGGRILRPAW